MPEVTVNTLALIALRRGCRADHDEGRVRRTQHARHRHDSPNKRPSQDSGKFERHPAIHNSPPMNHPERAPPPLHRVSVIPTPPIDH